MDKLQNYNFFFKDMDFTSTSNVKIQKNIFWKYLAAGV